MSFLANVTAGTRRGELDRFFSPDYTNATITVFYKNYDHATIKNAIERAKEYIATHTSPDDSVRYRLAGGLFGILAAQIEEVDWSYRVNVPLIFLVVFILLVLGGSAALTVVALREDWYGKGSKDYLAAVEDAHHSRERIIELIQHQEEPDGPPQGIPRVGAIELPDTIIGTIQPSTSHVCNMMAAITTPTATCKTPRSEWVFMDLFVNAVSRCTTSILSKSYSLAFAVRRRYTNESEARRNHALPEQI